MDVGIIETVIFDCSGVLIDDIYAVWKADSEVLEAYGFEKIERLREFKEVFMVPICEWYSRMGVPASRIAELERCYRLVYPKYSHHIRVFPEVKGSLEALKNERIVLAVVSNIPSRFLNEHLQRSGIDKYFEVVIGQDDCEVQKPSPRPLLTALERLGAKSERSAYVGDMEEDIIAAKRAQIHSFAVYRESSYHPLWKLERQRPDYLINDLSELLTIVKRLNAEG